MQQPSLSFVMRHWNFIVPSALPDPPEDPEIVSKSSHSVTLSWFTPLSNGGCGILGYNVERKPPDSGWQLCNEEVIPNTEFVVDNLRPGEPYRFRVATVNKVGVGKPVHIPQTVQLGEKWRCSHGASRGSPGLCFAWHACFHAHAGDLAQE